MKVFFFVIIMFIYNYFRNKRRIHSINEHIENLQLNSLILILQIHHNRAMRRIDIINDDLQRSTAYTTLYE